jgi:hypothetical protein
MNNLPGVPDVLTGHAILVTISNPTAVKFLTTLLLHEPFTPFSEEETIIGRQAIGRMYLTSPPYTVFTMPPDNPTTIGMFRYSNGHYTHIEVSLSRKEPAQVTSPVEATVTHRIGKLNHCITLFYYAMRSLDPSVVIPRLLVDFDRYWKYDHSTLANKQIDFEEVHCNKLSMRQLFTPHNTLDDITVAMLFHISGGTAIQLFRTHPDTFARFENSVHREMTRLFAHAPLTNPFEWDTLMTYALLLHRMFQVNRDKMMRPICKSIWDVFSKFPFDQTDPNAFPEKLPFFTIRSFKWF